MSTTATNGTILLAGASRGLGLGLAGEYLSRGWHVIATARTPGNATGLAELKAKYPEHLTVETLDVADLESVHALAGRVAATHLDVLFVVAGISGHGAKPVHQVPHAEVAQEFITNATSPIALAEALHASLTPQTTIAFMTSILGSIGSNAGGGMELYRATKAALNMLASCYALRHKASAVLLLHPGWVRTELGGEGAPLDVATSARGLADVIAWHGVRPGIAYLDYQGNKLPW
jgi:NAD(P)-dependent dehydrogenase (short-subunit alcohol dehydrogenase family)